MALSYWRKRGFEPLFHTVSALLEYCSITPLLNASQKRGYSPIQGRSGNKNPCDLRSLGNFARFLFDTWIGQWFGRFGRSVAGKTAWKNTNGVFDGKHLPKSETMQGNRHPLRRTCRKPPWEICLVASPMRLVRNGINREKQLLEPPLLQTLYKGAFSRAVRMVDCTSGLFVSLIVNGYPLKQLSLIY